MHIAYILRFIPLCLGKALFNLPMVIILLPNPACTLRLAKPYLYLAHNNYTTEIKMGNEKRKRKQKNMIMKLSGGL